MKKIDALRLKIHKLQDEILEIQSICLHKMTEQKHKSDTGNYDPSCDAYWVEFRCVYCDKKWIVEKK